MEEIREDHHYEGSNSSGNRSVQSNANWRIASRGHQNDLIENETNECGGEMAENDISGLRTWLIGVVKNHETRCNVRNLQYTIFGVKIDNVTEKNGNNKP